MQDLQNTPNGLITVQPHNVEPGMGRLGRGPEINREEAAAFREAVAAKKAKTEVAEAPEEPALASCDGVAFVGEEADLVTRLSARGESYV